MPTLLSKPITPDLLMAAAVTPILVDVPAASYLMVDGKGDPSTSADFDAAWKTLEPLAATLWLLIEPDSAPRPLPPLESIWWTDEDDGQEQGVWTLMVALPDAATIIHLEQAMEALRELNQELPALDRLRFGRLTEGKAVQVVQRGPYLPDGPTFERLLHFAHAHGYSLTGLRHEIYLTDPRRSTPCPLELLLRYPVYTP
ncbi:MAG TPA: GyrI-like domain-containing protein [Stenomitos sp.]